MFSPFVSLLALQVQSPGSVDRETLLVIFVGIIAFFFLALIAGLGAAAIYAMKLKRDVLKAIDAVKATVQEKAYPVVASTNDFIRHMTPKIQSITEDAVEISHTVRAQVTDIDSTLSDVTAKARAQADRVNGMVNSTLNTTSNVVSSVERGVKVPIREVAGVIAGLKAGWDVLIRPSAGVEKNEVKRAARHIQNWEEEIAHDAARAARVNPAPATTGYQSERQVRPATDAATQTVADVQRSVVDAGEEVASSAKDAATTARRAVEGATDELTPRRTL